MADAEQAPESIIERRPQAPPPAGFASVVTSRGFLFGIAGLIGAAFLGLVLASPLLMSRLAATGLDWPRLSAVGQTYGAAATLVTALSLASIAVSLLLQAQQTKLARQQAARTFHFDLVRMKLEDPRFLWAAGWPRAELQTAEERTTDRIRQHLYANMWIYHWLTSYETGSLSEANLRALLAREFFNGEVGRQYWVSTGSTFTVMTNRTERRFFGIVEQEYRRAVESGRPPIPATGPPQPHQRQVSPWAALRGGAVMGAATAGFLAGAAATRSVRWVSDYWAGDRPG